MPPPDLSNLSDAELQAIAAPARAGPDLSHLSDAELQAIVRGSRPDPLDVAKGFGVGAGEGAIGVAGIPGDAAVLAGQGIAKLQPAAPALTGEQRAVATASGALAPAAQPAPPEGKLPSARPVNPFTSAAIRQAVEGYTGPFYQPQTPEGRVARTAGQMLPAMAVGGPEGLASRALTRVIAPTIGSEVAQRATAGTPYEPYAGPAGAMLGALSPRAASRIITPLPADPHVAAMAHALEGEGVPTYAGQATRRPWLQGYEGKPPGQEEAFTSAALRRMGVPEGPALPGVVAPEVQAMGREYNALAARNNLHWDPTLSDQMVDIAKRYGAQMPAEQRAVFQKHVGDLYQTYGNVVPGPVYAEKVSALGTDARRIAQSDPTTSAALRELQGALKGAMDRSITQYNPADAGAWRGLDRRYAAWKTLAPTMGVSTPEKAAGVITPQALASAAERRNKEGVAQGRSDLGELARAGQVVMTSQERNPILGHANIPTLLGALAGAGAGYGAGGAEHAVLGTLLGTPVAAAAVQAARPVVTSGFLQPWLKNQFLAPWQRNLDPASQTALISAALTRPGASGQIPGPAQQPGQ